MIPRYVSIVWIDHTHADVFQLNETGETKVVINSHTSVQRQHHQPQPQPDVGEREPADAEFFARAASALSHTASILVAGSGQTKFEFLRYLNEHGRGLAAHVQELGTGDHPNHVELIALAREHFQNTTSATLEPLDEFVQRAARGVANDGAQGRAEGRHR
jgi:stalled ribosome rescue protein Dom34